MSHSHAAQHWCSHQQRAWTTVLFPCRVPASTCTVQLVLLSALNVLQSQPLTGCLIADAWGTVALLFCLGAGAAYQQPPLRSASQPKGGKEEEPLITKKGGSMV